MEWGQLVLFLVVITVLWVAGLVFGYHWGRGRGYEDGYDVGYAEATVVCWREGGVSTGTYNEEWRRAIDSGELDGVHIVKGSRHRDKP